MYRFFLVIHALCVSPTLHAQSGDTTSLGSGLLPLVLNLGLVLAIIVLLGWFFGRSARLGGRADSGLDIVATRMVGNRERLVVVQVGNEQVLLGVTAQNITPLLTLDEPIATTAERAPLTGAFAQRLASMRVKQSAATESDS